jgi:IS30 family transposase
MISREIRRNRAPDGAYWPYAALPLRCGGRRPKSTKLAANQRLRVLVQDCVGNWLRRCAPAARCANPGSDPEQRRGIGKAN